MYVNPYFIKKKHHHSHHHDRDDRNNERDDYERSYPPRPAGAVNPARTAPYNNVLFTLLLISLIFLLRRRAPVIC
jgi:hypothetical protein